MRSLSKRVAFLLGCLVMNASIASAAQVLDQQFDPTGYAAQATEASGYLNVAQSFTAGASGELGAIDLYLSLGQYNGIVNSGYDLAVNIARMDSITLDNNKYTLGTTSLGGITVPYSSVEYIPNGANWININLSSQNINLETGQRYAIVLSSLAAPYDFGGDYKWYGGYTGTTIPAYPGETLYYRQVSNDIDQGEAYWRSDPLAASGFRTYVDSSSSSVPIPGAVWLLGSGLLGLVGFRKRIEK